MHILLLISFTTHDMVQGTVIFWNRRLEILAADESVEISYSHNFTLYLFCINKQHLNVQRHNLV